jgi:hypothetical protein
MEQQNPGDWVTLSQLLLGAAPKRPAGNTPLASLSAILQNLNRQRPMSEEMPGGGSSVRPSWQWW